VSPKAEANGIRHNTKPTQRKGVVPDADDNRAGKCKTLTTSSGEVQDADDNRAGKCKTLTTSSGEAQDDDDDGRGRANTPGEEVGERKNASERGGSGATPSSRHSCYGPMPRNALAQTSRPAVGAEPDHPTQVVGAQRGRTGL
jgi:hypothetical protein